ncbi:uncharacterized protein LOC102678563, partial [Apis dorsata]|uniref:uncharacterized protein LOC102678563 n=1 Tax=Apis dorsata TaxID=7462 RepID=UPI0003DF6894
FRGEFPQDERLMCYMKCILISTKAMKNDVILWDFFVKNARMILLEEYIPRVESVVETCKKEVTATEGCEVAWQFGKCIYENDKEVIFKYDYAENNTLALFSAMNDLSIENSRYYRGSKRNFYTPAHRRYLGHHVHNRGKAVCRNTRTKPQCRRV